jgi:TatA/E family protein of Tat protein translocase
MLNVGPGELLLILLVALLVVGPSKLPELGRSLGKGLRELRRAQDEVRRTIQVDLDDEPPAPRRATRPLPEDAGGTGPAGPATDPGTIRDVSRTLGRGLAEIRRAREEVQRSFRVELDEPPARDAGEPE